MGSLRGWGGCEEMMLERREGEGAGQGSWEWGEARGTEADVRGLSGSGSGSGSGEWGVGSVVLGSIVTRAFWRSAA